MECSILRIATYHKGLEGCDGFQNLFMICMRLLVKGEKNPSATSSSSRPAQHPLPRRTQGCRARRVLGDVGLRQHGLQERAKIPQVSSSPPCSM